MQKLTNKQLDFLIGLSLHNSLGERDLINLPGLRLRVNPKAFRVATKSLEKMLESCKGFVKVKPVHVSLHFGSKETSKMYYIVTLTPKGEGVVAPILEEQKQAAQKKQEEDWKRQRNMLDSVARDMYGKPYAKCGPRQQDAIHRDLAGWTG